MTAIRTWLHGLTLDTRLTLGLTILITAVPLVPATAQAACAGGVACLTGLAWYRRCKAAAPVGVFSITCLALAAMSIPYSQVILGGGLIGYALFVRSAGWMREVPRWEHWGSFGWGVQVLTVVSALVAAIVLLAWYHFLRPNVDEIVRAFVPAAAPLRVLIVGGLLFSMVNAAVEEAAYRGVLLHGLDMTLGRGSVAIALQAVAFGALHIHGFPNGVVGIGLATVYGIFMGLIRRRANGMFAPWLAHVLTDIVIAAIVIAIARPTMLF